MRVLLVNGSPRKNGNTHEALGAVEKELLERGIETEWFQIGNNAVHGCISCGTCRGTNRCAFGKDGCNELIEKLLAADGVIIGSPVYFAGPNGALCALLDRVFYATCTYCQMFKGKAAAALVTCAWTGGTAALDRLHRYFVPCQMPIVTSGDYTVFQGDSVRNKEERSMQLIRELAGNMANQLYYGKSGVRKGDGE